MKILSLGLDSLVLNKDSKLAKRIIEYGELVDSYVVMAPDTEDKSVHLSDKVRVYGVGAKNKVICLFKIYNLGKKVLSKEQYDVITVQDQYYLALIGWWLAKKFSIGLEIQVHGFEKFYGLRKVIAGFVVPRADAVRAVSQRLARQLVSDFGVEESRITVVPIYVDARNLKFEIGNLEKEKMDKFIFLTVGRLVAVKNIGMQIRAMAGVIKKSEVRSKKLELWIAGDGSAKRNLKLEIGNLGLESNIKLLGWQDDLGEFYRQADVFLLTSDYEGWGLAVIEAASFGLSIIMTDVGCAGEVIRGIRRRTTNAAHANENNEQSGIVIPVGGQKKLEDAMIQLIEDEELRSRLGKNARQAIKRLPSKEETLKLYKRSWEKAIRSKK